MNRSPNFADVELLLTLPTAVILPVSGKQNDSNGVVKT
jgi:hypothetical protein